MSVALVIQPICDPHMRDHDEHVGGEQHIIEIDGVRVAVETCPDCDSAYLEPARRLLGYGRREKAAPAPSPPVPVHACPDCGHKVKSRSGLTRHMNQRHPRGRPAPEPAPIPAAEPNGQPGFRCEEPTTEGGTTRVCGRIFSRAASLGVHRYRVHGIAGKTSRATQTAGAS